MPSNAQPVVASPDGLRDRTVAVVGYGNQGAAHALNLRDSGVDVVVANRPGATADRAVAAGFEVRSIRDAVGGADLVIVAVPDECHAEVWERDIAPNLEGETVLGFLHGFSVHYGFVAPPVTVGVVMVAPKGPGATLRERFEAGAGLPCLFAVHQETPGGTAEAIGLGWAAGIGAMRAAIVRTTFRDETETDLFGEQCVLCGGLATLIRAAFETLVEAGYPAELAYLECGQEVKQIADLVYRHGLAETMQRISNTAEFGAHEAGPVLIDDAVRDRMRARLADIQDGSFARRFLDDHAAGGSWFQAQRTEMARHALEDAGKTVRSWWAGE